MAARGDEKALIEAYFDVIRDGGIDRLAGIVADDYQDHNPVRGQWIGRLGILQKVLRFREEHPGATIVIEAIEVAGPTGGPEAPTLRVTWVTTAPNLDGTPAMTAWRYVGVFEFEGGKIRSSEVERVGQVV